MDISGLAKKTETDQRRWHHSVNVHKVRKTELLFKLLLLTKPYNHHSQNNWRQMSCWLFTTKNQQWHLWIEIILLVAWMIMNHVCLKSNLTSTAFSEALWNASDIIVGCSPLLSKLRHCFSKAPAKTTTAQPKYSSTFSHHARTFIVHFTLDKHCQITNGPRVKQLYLQTQKSNSSGESLSTMWHKLQFFENGAVRWL